MSSSLKANVTFYKVEKCGFYKYRGKTPEFGNLAEFFNELIAWTKGKGFLLTKLQNVDDHSDLPVYVLDAVQGSTGDFVLTLWNGLSDGDDDAVASIDSSHKVGQPLQVHSNPIKTGSVAGYPSYFWIIPQRGVVATVTVRPGAGRLPMIKYINTFIATRSQYLVVGPNKEGVKKAAYAPLGGACMASNRVSNVFPRFDMKTFMKSKGDLSVIHANYDDIASTVIKADIDAATVQKKNRLLSMVSFLEPKTSKKGQVSKRQKIKLELGYRPSLEELQEIENKFSDGGVSSWEDMGFKIKGKGDKTFWIKSSIAKGVLDMKDPKAVTGSVIEADVLLKELTENRALLLSNLV